MLLIGISKDDEMLAFSDFFIRVGAIYKLLVDVFGFLLVGVFGCVVAIFLCIKDDKILWYKAICPRFFAPLFHRQTPLDKKAHKLGRFVWALAQVRDRRSWYSHLKWWRECRGLTDAESLQAHRLKHT